jgi:hypothetical protein
MEHKKLICFTDKYRPHGIALVGDFFYPNREPDGSNFLPVGDDP